MAQDWDIKARGDHCHTCEDHFRDGQAYYSALIFGEQGYVRADYCGKCWSGLVDASSPYYSSWQGVFRDPPPPPEEVLKKETAESLLRNLIAKDDESNKNVMFILAVMLERKRTFVERDQQTHDDGVTVRIYEHRRTGETFVVSDPNLRLDELEPVQQEVITMLGGHTAQAEAGDTGAGSDDQTEATESQAPDEVKEKTADQVQTLAAAPETGSNGISESTNHRIN